MEWNAAELIAKSVAAMAEIEAMKLQNELDRQAGRPLSYDPQSFWNVQGNLDINIRDLR